MKHIIFFILLIIATTSCHKRINSSVTTITKDSSITIKKIEKDTLLEGSHVSRTINEDSLKAIGRGESRIYWDSLHNIQMKFFRDSLGNLHEECIEGDKHFHYTYPEKTITYNIHTKTKDTLTIEKTSHELSFWYQLLIGALIGMNILFLIILFLVIIKK